MSQRQRGELQGVKTCKDCSCVLRRGNRSTRCFSCGKYAKRRDMPDTFEFILLSQLRDFENEKKALPAQRARATRAQKFYGALVGG